MTIRAATDEETLDITGFFEGIEHGSSQTLFAEHDFWIVDRDGERTVTAASMDLAELPIEVLAGSDHIGLRIGTLEDDGFRMDLQAAVLLSEVSRRQTVRVNEHAARLFLYGKQILGSSVLSHAQGVRYGDACIVVNPRWEALGIGEVIGPFRGKGPAVDPIYDLGTYLRDQQ